MPLFADAEAWSKEQRNVFTKLILSNLQQENPLNYGFPFHFVRLL